MASGRPDLKRSFSIIPCFIFVEVRPGQSRRRGVWGRRCSHVLSSCNFSFCLVSFLLRLRPFVCPFFPGPPRPLGWSSLSAPFPRPPATPGPARQSVLLGAVVLLAYRLEYTDTFPVHRQGFFCYDSAYAKPYPGPEAASRAPPALIYPLVTAGPAITILLGELARAFFPAPASTAPALRERTIVCGDCCRFSPALRRLVRFLGVYSFGLFTTSIFANAGQVVTGNPTPHFLSVCHPNYTALGCPPPATDKPGLDRYVTDQGACAAGNPALVAAARRAFPCKDAALCAFAVTYTAMYVTLVFRVKGSRLVKPSLCLALLCPAFLVGVVRVAEYRNHWSDVLAGFLTGAAIATFLVTCVVNKFQSRVPLSQRTFRWEGLGTVPAIENPLEKLNSAQSCRAVPVGAT
uniref:Phospholipid phosphatase-related protein type 2 n=1 Tax=Sarcophilus harrisii TaxID=9305 RepID=A0A7N4PPL4_SARHA